MSGQGIKGPVTRTDLRRQRRRCRGPGAEPRLCAGDETGTDAARGPDHRDEHVRTRRPGHFQCRQASGRDDEGLDWRTDESEQSPAVSTAGLFVALRQRHPPGLRPNRAFRHKLSFIGTNLVPMNPGLNP